MKKLVVVAVLGTTLIWGFPLPARAGGAADAALALGAFAVFSHLVAGPLWARPWYPPVYVAPAPIGYPAPVYGYPAPVYSARPVTYNAPPAIQREVVYAHGRHVLYGDGVTTAYRWVWVPNPPPPAAAPPLAR